jgi:hypothetical protein
MLRRGQLIAVPAPAWGSWFGQLGQAIVDPGNPFGPAATVTNGGSVSDGASS